MTDLLPIDSITGKFLLIRGQKVILDRDLAKLYGVETRTLKQAVRRNIRRFPKDFMFSITNQEVKDLTSQLVISSWGGTRHKPMAFTELGVAMLSSVLKSEQAIEVNIQIMRAFTQLRHMIASHEELKMKLVEMEAKYDEQFQIVFQALRQLIEEDEKPKQKIGF